jgi:iron-regulated transporter 1
MFLTGLSFLACVEKLSSVLNTIAVERDWVVIVAEGHEKRLRGIIHCRTTMIHFSD